MVELSIREDCGNAPKQQFIKDFNIAFANADKEQLLSSITDDAEWQLVGDTTYVGKAAIRDALASMTIGAAKKLTLNTVLSHGTGCAANGVITFEDAEVAFCEVYEFSSHGKDARIKKLTSYRIPLKQGNNAFRKGL